jgi:hypothetical protein
MATPSTLSAGATLSYWPFRHGGVARLGHGGCRAGYDFPYWFKAGPAGGRLRRPSSRERPGAGVWASELGRAELAWMIVDASTIREAAITRQWYARPEFRAEQLPQL